MTTVAGTSLELLARADLLLLLADAFRAPSQALGRLTAIQPEDAKALVRAAKLPADDDLLRLLPSLLSSVREFHIEAWSDEYHRLFEGAMVCPLNETVYIRRDKGAIIGDLAGYYRAFGWTSTTDLGEKPDHLLVELEFLAVLLVMTAQADEMQNPSAAEVTHLAMSSFASNHLADWITAACERLVAVTIATFYRDAAMAISSFWRSLSAAHHWVFTSTTASFSVTPDDETPYECGAPDAEAFVPLTIARPSIRPESV